MNAAKYFGHISPDGIRTQFAIVTTIKNLISLSTNTLRTGKN